jgi:hypothetical protein
MLVSSFEAALVCSADAAILVPEELLAFPAVVADVAAATLCTEACAVALCAAFIAFAMRAAAAFFGVLAANLRSASFLRVSSAALVLKRAHCLDGALTLDIARIIAHNNSAMRNLNTFQQRVPPSNCNKVHFVTVEHDNQHLPHVACCECLCMIMQSCLRACRLAVEATLWNRVK